MIYEIFFFSGPYLLNSFWMSQESFLERWTLLMGGITPGNPDFHLKGEHCWKWQHVNRIWLLAVNISFNNYIRF